MPEVIESAVPEVSVDSAVPETVETETPTIETETTESETTTPETETTQETEETTADGKQMPAKFKSYLKELQATDPRLAKQLRGDWYALQQIRQSYPGGMKDIQRVAQIAESIGGEEGLAAIEAERSEWNALDQQFSTGDPKFVENIADQDPEAFRKLVPHAITKFANLDPEGYSHLMAGVVVNTVKDIATKMYNALSATDAGKPLAQELAAWFNDLDKLAREKPVPKVDPEREKLTKERTDWENQKAQEYHESVTNEMRAYNSKEIDAELSRQLTKVGRNPQDFRKQNPDSYRILMENCNAELQAMAQKDQVFLKQYSAMLQTGDKSKALTMARAKTSRMITGDGQNKGAVAKTLRAFLAFGGPTKAAPKLPTNGNGNGKLTTEVQLSKMPDSKDIDWSRTSKGMVLSGKAYLKSRKEMVRF